MNSISIDDLINKVAEYNREEVDIVRKAYDYAAMLHQNQYRESGEPYITHPLNVAYILAEMHADRDTLCAGLLHDTIEDTNTTKENIAHIFNPNIANLVDGVTKLAKMNFSSKKELSYANTKKIIISIQEDVRIIIIKLADRLHNMRTLQYKSEFKQKENALETMEIFVPLAYYIGAYRIKSELEDLSFRYLKPNIYKNINDVKLKIESDSRRCLIGMLGEIRRVLNDKGISNEIKVRTKNIYGIYKKLNEGQKLSEIHDLLALKIMVDNIPNCYYTLGIIHQLYHPINDKFKDYICNPKTNMYQSLHTTVFGLEDRLVQTQIRTFDMDKVASFGLTTYWDLLKGKARFNMQEDLRNNFQFFKSLSEIAAIFDDNRDFVELVKKELFSDMIYVYDTKGNIIELPKGSTPVDLAYKLGDNIGNCMIDVLVNNKSLPFDYVLRNKDRVKIITDDSSFKPNEGWLKMANTNSAREKIKQYIKIKRRH